MYHCHTLYVLSILTCPEIKKSLALFLFTDLFNSSTNCLLYSLSGRVFRRKFISINKLVFTCGRGVIWNAKHHPTRLPSQQIELQGSNDRSTFFNYGIYSRPDSYHRSEHVSSIRLRTFKRSVNHRSLENDRSITNFNSDYEHNIDHVDEIEYMKKSHRTDKFKQRRAITTFFISKVHYFGSTKNVKATKRKQIRFNRNSQYGRREKLIYYYSKDR